MATLEAATVELQQLNGTSDLQLEAMFEQQDAISALSANMDNTNAILLDILDVMRDFVRAVPQEISKGYDALLSFQEKQALLASREDDRNINPVVDGSTPTPTAAPAGEDGLFKSNFKKGMEKDLGFVSKIKDNIAEAIVVAGSVAAVFGKTFKGIGKALRGLASIAASIGKFLLPVIKVLGTALRGVIAAISLPFALITAALVGLAMGVMSFVEDFRSEEGTFMDKWIAGLGGFVKGFMKLITVPLDLLKEAIAWVAGALGFDDFETMLDGFSFTDGFGEIVDAVVGFVQSVKDSIADTVKGAINSLGGMFGLDPVFEDKPEPVTVPAQSTPTAVAEPEVQRSYPVLSPEGEVIGQESTPEAASQQAMKVGGYVGNPTVVAEGPTTSAVQVTPESPVAAVAVKADGKRGMTIGDSPAAPSEVKANGKRGMTIGRGATKVKDDPDFARTESVPTKVESERTPMTPFEREEASDRSRETLMANPDRAVDQYGNLIPLEETASKVESGIKRGKTIGDSPAAAVKVKENGKRGMTIGSAPAAAVKVKENGKRGMAIDTPSKVKIPEGVRVTPAGKYASYNSETNTQAFFSNVKDAVTFINAPIEQAAKMDAYAAKVYEERKKSESAPKRVLKSKSKSDVTPIVSSLGSPEKRGMLIGDSPAAPSEVGANGKRGMVIGGSDRVAMTDTMRSEQNKLDAAKSESSSKGDVAVVNANNNSTNVVNKTTTLAAPSAVDRSDRTDRRGAFRGRAI
jgi:hypothetical protein